MASIWTRQILTWVLAGLATILLAILAVHKLRQDRATVRLGDQRLEVPSSYLDAMGQAPAWLQTLPGLDINSRSILLIIPADDIKNAIPEYKANDGRYRNNLQLHLVALDGHEKRRHESSEEFADIWRSQGTYRGRIVERDPRHPIFRVYRKIEYQDAWEALTINPDSTQLPDDRFRFWLGNCLLANSPLTQSGQIQNCSSYAIVGNIAIFFRFNGDNIALIPKLREHLIQRVSDWRRSHSNRQQ